MRVVQRPVGRRRARAGRGERFRRLQHGERGEESAVRPADHGDAAEIGLRNVGCRILASQRFQRFRQRAHGVDLVFERYGFHGFVDGAVPLRAASGGAASVGGDPLHILEHLTIPLGASTGGAATVRSQYDIALIGPPLRVPIEGLTFDDLLEAGASVGFHEYRQDGFVRVFTIG